MNFYQLENKNIDANFLSGKPVLCDAVITVSDYSSGMLKAGERIVVLLSSGKKFMGEINSSTFKMRGNLAEGKLEIVRYAKK